MSIPVIFSVIFSLACAGSAFFGIYILYINPYSSTNKIFFALNMALTIWALSFSIAISAPDFDTCLLWRRISAFGWGSFFSILLHFFMALTGKKELLKKWWVYFLLYIPSAATILAFSFFPAINPGQYNLLQTPFGWTNKAVNNGWDWFHSIYYATFAIIGFIMVWLWGKKSKDKKTKRQSRLILVSFIASIFLGSVTDIFFDSIFPFDIPQMAPLFMIPPIIAMYYTIKKYGLMTPEKVFDNDIIMNNQTRDKMFVYFSNAFFAGGVINFISQYIFYDNAQLGNVLLNSFILIIMGLVFKVIQRSKLSAHQKDLFNAAAILIIIPLVTLKFIDFASVTIWAFPFFILIFSLIFSKRYILIAISISIIITQILV